MKEVLLLSVAGLLAAAASAATTIMIVKEPSESPSGEEVVSPNAPSFEVRMDSLEKKQRELDHFLTMLSIEADQPQTAAREERAIASAVDTWLSENAGSLVAANGGEAEAIDPEEGSSLAAIRRADISDLIDLISDGTLTGADRQTAWQRIAEAGRLEEVVQELERLIELDPQDPDLRVTLGNTYLQQLFAGASGPKAGELAGQADAAFAAALDLDENHWEARFMKAVSLSNWPAFLGKQGEAIAEFERLVEIQEQQNAEPRQAQTYLFLGNMYLDTGNQSQALATWKRGLKRFPASDELRRQIDLNGGGQ